MSIGKVYLVGAGPGDPGLITRRGAELVARAEVVIADYLVNPALLELAPPSAEVLLRPPRRTGPLGDQADINRTLVEKAQAGKVVVRLKGGDPFVFGRGGEEAEVLTAAGVPFEIVPGVTAAVAAPAYAGIPITHRGLAGVVAFATGHETDEKDGGHIDWDAVARGAGTLVLYMSVKRLPDVIRRLLAAGRGADEPVAVVEQGTLPGQRVVTGTLADIVARAEAAGVRPPALTIVGPVVGLRERIAWFRPRPRVLFLSTKEAPTSEDAEVVHVSPLTVVPRFAEVKRALGRLGELRAIAFASTHAVDAVVGALMALGHDVRALAGVKLAAVGEATARRLSDMHLSADLVASAGGEALAAEIVAGGLSGPVLLPRAAGGREDLNDRLRAAGLETVAVDAYDTIPDDAALAGAARAHRARPFDAVAFTSPKGVQAFLEVLGRPSLLEGARLGAIGETTAAALRAAGLSPDVVPERPDAAALLAGLLAAPGTRR